VLEPWVIITNWVYSPTNGETSVLTLWLREHAIWDGPTCIQYDVDGFGQSRIAIIIIIIIMNLAHNVFGSPGPL